MYRTMPVTVSTTKDQVTIKAIRERVEYLFLIISNTLLLAGKGKETFHWSSTGAPGAALSHADIQRVSARVGLVR